MEYYLHSTGGSKEAIPADYAHVRACAMAHTGAVAVVYLGLSNATEAAPVSAYYQRARYWNQEFYGEGMTIHLSTETADG